MMDRDERGTQATAARSRPSRWHLPVWWANGIAVAVLLLTYAAPHVSPRAFWPLALLAMAFPLQLPLHGLFMAYWLAFRRKRMLLSGLALLAGAGHIADHVQLAGRSAPPEGALGEPVKLLSWNVRLFDLYHWGGEPQVRDAIFEVLAREDAGILCLQEFFHSSDRLFFRTRDALVRDLGYAHEHAAWTHEARLDQHFGIATFSRHPIVGRGRIPFGRKTNNACIWSDIRLGEDTLRVFNAHLASVHFGDADYRFLDSLGADAIKAHGWRILRLLRDGAMRRADEAARIDSAMRASPHPVVFCGDINDVPMSYAYRRLRGDMDDAFVESGRGLGGTYIGKLPRLRIDYILHGKAIAGWGFRRLPEELSDHHANAVMLARRKP